MTVAQVLWQSPATLPAAVATLGVMLAAVLWLYPGQVRGLPRPWRWVMPLLRAMAIVTLVASLVQPAVLRPRTLSQQGAVVVLVDRSKSMGIVDTGRTPAELVALAAGLGALAEDVRVDAAPQLRSRLAVASSLLEEVERLRRETEYARISGRAEAGAAVRLRENVDALRAALRTMEVATTAPTSGAVPQELSAIVAELKQSGQTLDQPALGAIRDRLGRAMTALDQLQARLDTTLYERDGSVRAVCDRLGRSTRLEFAERALMDRNSGLLAKLRATTPIVGFAFAEEIEGLASMSSSSDELFISANGSASDVTGAARWAMRRMRARPVQAVVVLSDGRQVGGGDDAQGPDMSALGAPVYTISTAAALRRDVAVTAVDVPETARTGEMISARVEVSGVGVRGETAEVLLDTGDVRQVRRVTFSEESRASVEFRLTLHGAGSQAVVATARALANEISDENNRVQRWIKVAPEPLKLTVVSAADAGKQFTSLHAEVSRPPWVVLREVAEDETYRLTPAAILAQDVVVLCDLPPEALTRVQWDALDELVRVRGASVIMTAGAHLPVAYAQHASADWLPQELGERFAWRSWPGGEPHFRLIAPRGGSGTSLRSDTGVFGEAWENLPAVSHLVSVTRPRPGVRTLLAERGSGAGVVTESSRGVGRVYFVGTDESWRWRGAPDAADAQQFWTALLKRAAPQPYGAVEENLALDAASVEIEPGEQTTLRARVFTRDGFPADAATQAVDVFRGDEKVTSIALSAAREGMGRYEGLVSGLSEGDYRLRLEPPEDPSAEEPADPATLTLHVTSELKGEMTDLSGDESVLRRMAESSGGRMIELNEIATLPRILLEHRGKEEQLVEYRLWDSPYLFVFVLACLSAEWALRKRFGLV